MSAFPVKAPVILATLLLMAGCCGAAAAGEDDPARRALIEALAETRLEADGLRAEIESRAFGRYGAWNPDAGDGAIEAAALEGLRVLDVNRELGMLILGGGRRDGLRAGMRFALMSGARVTAYATVVDVRREISGALIERGEPRAAAAGSYRPVLLREGI